MKYLDLPYKEQKSAILHDINTFVRHSEIVYKRPKFYSKHNPIVLQEIELIKNYLYEINKYSSLHQICLKIWQLKKRLYKILPHVNNDSYQSQFEKLVNMIEFATLQTTPKILN